MSGARIPRGPGRGLGQVGTVLRQLSRPTRGPLGGNAEAAASGRVSPAAVSAATPVTPVSAVIKATVLDTAYLAVTAAHMLAQARYPFCDKTIVVDWRSEFQGKYQTRTRSTRAELEDVLSDLLDRKVIDRVVDAPTDRDAIESVMSLYFGDEGPRIPTHGTAGCPVYATLFALENAASDLVVQFDADMMFYAAGPSWVADAVRVLEENPEVWLAMTHAGPPAGPVGTRRSLGPFNARGSEWDGARGIWKFQWATTRYFLTDRTRLHRKLEPLWEGEAVLPLEDCLSAALKRENAYRIHLAHSRSWDLHAFDHDDPFPEWAPHLVWLVERGVVPPSQRGEYDLRLDMPFVRRAWAPLVADAARKSILAGSSLPSRALANRSL